MEQILAADGRPFRDVDAANLKCKSLKRELGESVHCRVQPHRDGGYAVLCGDDDLAIESAIAATTQPTTTQPIRDIPRAAAMTSDPNVDWNPAPARTVVTQITDRKDGKQEKRAWRNKPTTSAAAAANGRASNADARDKGVDQTATSRTITLTPAMRAFPFRWVQILGGVTFMVRPSWFVQLFGVPMPNDELKAVVVLTTISVLSMVIVIMSLCFISWMYMSNSYVFDVEGVEQVQWYRPKGSLWPRRHRPRVKYRDIRAISIDQSFLQTIMNVGHVRLASGGTDGYEIELKYLVNPKQIERELNGRRQESINELQPSF